LSRPNSTSRRRSWGTAVVESVASRRLALVLGVVVVSFCAGCSDAKMDFAVRRLFEPKRTPQQYMIIAVSDADPDVRRSAVAKIAKSDRCDQEWAIKGFIAIALLESDPQARCVAVRALSRIDDPRAVETLLKILNYRDYPPAEIRPPGDLCRWDATAALGKLAAGSLSDDTRAAVKETLLARLELDPDRHVRIAAAKGLQHFAELPVVRGLIEGLRDEDFAVVYRCEHSLARLTGVTHDCDPYQWNQWLEEHGEDTFAKSGTLPESRRAPYSGRWGKFRYNTKQFFQWIFPGKKE